MLPGNGRFFVVHGVSFRQHPLVEDARDENAAGLAPERYDCLPCPCGAGRIERDRRSGLTRGCRRGFDSTLQGRRYNARSGLRPTCAECRRRFPSGRTRRGRIGGTRPMASVLFSRLAAQRTLACAACESWSVRRTRSKGFPSATPLRSPASTADRSAASLASNGAPHAPGFAGRRGRPRWHFRSGRSRPSPVRSCRVPPSNSH